MDAKPWRVCLSSGWRWESDANANRIAKCYTYCYSDGNHNTDRNTFANANPHLPGDLYDSYCHWQR